MPAFPSILRVALNGMVEPDEDACKATGWDPEIVRTTIKCLNLNCERLQGARKKRLEDLGKWYNDADAELLKAAARKDLLPDETGRLPPFFTTARSFFREAAELVLAEHPQRWI